MKMRKTQDIGHNLRDKTLQDKGKKEGRKEGRKEQRRERREEEGKEGQRKNIGRKEVY